MCVRVVGDCVYAALPLQQLCQKPPPFPSLPRPPFHQARQRRTGRLRNLRSSPVLRVISKLPGRIRRHGCVAISAIPGFARYVEIKDPNSDW
eukprot:1134175-Pyramimonas_sp.AAC.3